MFTLKNLDKKRLAYGILAAVFYANTISAFAQEQIVSGALSAQEVSPGGIVDLTISYQATNDVLLTGLGLRMHFDSSDITLGDFSYKLRDSFLGSQIQDDTDNFDSDVSTDKFLLVAWADTSGDG